MSRLTTIIRLAACLAFLGVGAMLLTDALGLIPSTASLVRRQRVALCQSLAMFLPGSPENADFDPVEGRLAALVRSNPEIESIGIRDAAGRLIVDINQHQARWNESAGSGVSVEYTPVEDPRAPLRIEVWFSDAAVASVFGQYSTIPFEVMLLAGSVSFVLFFPFLRRVLEEFDPAKILPSRVRCALDSLAEGLLLLDNERRIVLANKAFAELVSRPREALSGQRADDLPWVVPTTGERLKTFPWHQVLREQTSVLGETLGMIVANNERRVFLVNSAPIVDEQGIHRGVLVSVDDVTVMESKKQELSSMVSSLQKSQQEVEEQNRELQCLANRDSLTGCLNRRSFFEEFQLQWVDAERLDRALSVIMIDVDNFKHVNDQYGHAAGDEVLQEFGNLLRKTAPRGSLVARYGGEEFSITLTSCDIAEAFDHAEHIRDAIAAHAFGTLRVTASMGVSSRSQGGRDTQQLLEQADKSLYVAKRSGRNLVVAWNQVADGESVHCRRGDLMQGDEQEQRPGDGIPFTAVTALLSTLAYRDVNTASHSLRVADLCAMVARKLMSVRDAYLLEVAALLHDIGKVGVPDAILLKPGKLSREEWRTMRRHGRIGIEIVRSSFANENLTNLIRWHHTDSRQRPGAEAIPIGARILAIADAFDSMTNNHVYRQTMSAEQAFAELRRCSGTQFDSRIVEVFIDVVRGQQAEAAAESDVAPAHVVLAIGKEIETIAHAVDEQDLDGLSSLAMRLEGTAAKNGLSGISELAATLCRQMEDEPNLLRIIETTHELLDMCRAMQHVYVHHEDPASEPIFHSANEEGPEPPRTTG